MASPASLETQSDLSGIVAIMDDEKSICAASARMLSRNGYQPLTAENDIVLLELIKSVRPHAFFLDNDIAGRGPKAIPTARALLEFGYHPSQITVWSGKGGDELSEGISSLGLHYIQKPFTMDRLLQAAYQVVSFAKTLPPYVSQGGS